MQSFWKRRSTRKPKTPTADTQSVPQSTPTYDTNTDYSALMQQAAQTGNLSLAAQYEQQRNAKIEGEGLSYATSSQYAPFAAFHDEYGAELSALSEQLENRPAFSYDMNEDALYQQYAAQYEKQGKTALRDTQGRAAALTGGYGSSYAETAGQQAYNDYLQQLGALVPSLYEQAAKRYDAQTDTLSQRYSLLAEQRENAYDRYTDARQAALSQRQTAYQTLASLIASSGYSPSDAELAAAGMTRAQAAAYVGKQGGTGGTTQPFSSLAQLKIQLEKIRRVNGPAAANGYLTAVQGYLSETEYNKLLRKYPKPIKPPLIDYVNVDAWDD